METLTKEDIVALPTFRLEIEPSRPHDRGREYTLQFFARTTKGEWLVSPKTIAEVDVLSGNGINLLAEAVKEAWLGMMHHKDALIPTKQETSHA